MTGSSARFARGASHQNRTVSAHCAPAAAFNAAMRWTTAAVSGFAGGVAGCCARKLAMARMMTMGAIERTRMLSIYLRIVL